MMQLLKVRDSRRPDLEFVLIELPDFNQAFHTKIPEIEIFQLPESNLDLNPVEIAEKPTEIEIRTRNKPKKEEVTTNG